MFRKYYSELEVRRSLTSLSRDTGADLVVGEGDYLPAREVFEWRRTRPLHSEEGVEMPLTAREHYVGARSLGEGYNPVGDALLKQSIGKRNDAVDAALRPCGEEIGS